MTLEVSAKNLSDLQQKAYQHLVNDDLLQAANLYEQAIAAFPSVTVNYWYLGLALILQGKETEAQTTWLLVMSESTEAEIEEWIAELSQVLETEAQRQAEISKYEIARLIRLHLREINPANINNILHLIELAIKLKIYTEKELINLRVLEVLSLPEMQGKVDDELLIRVLQQLLDYTPLYSGLWEFTEACIPYIQQPHDFTKIIIPACINLAFSLNQYALAAALCELAFKIDKNPEILRHLSVFYQNDSQYMKAIEKAKLCYSLSSNLPDKIYANYLLIRALLGTGGYWKEVVKVFQEHESLLSALIAENPMNIDAVNTTRLWTTTFSCPYIDDNPVNHRQLQNQLAQLCQTNFQIQNKEKVEQYYQGHVTRRKNISKLSKKPLKIGYISNCFYMHSVGWLARWILQYHDRQRFQLYGYFINYASEEVKDPLRDWYVTNFDEIYKAGINSQEIAEKIYQDEIDILVELDSITVDINGEILALKSAPIQVSWLGFDAPGLPAIDYFIADPYVLPESAQDYYSETIWRLPQTYIAVDGFEVDVPTLRRDILDIPNDGVVYFSNQTGYKRHPDTIRLQMKIIKEVPNSYFLVKGRADQEAVKNFFIRIAEEEGVNIDKFRFLPQVASEAIHRANIGIADIVLDTYPYNGATTTLETLWMGIPLVTRVGQQFSARNSYGMMMNVGVTEGIAWTDEEYIEWGIRLGKDANLRQQIACKLRQSRHNAPLWNAEKFTREMEKAYEQMWERYLDR